MAEEEPKEPTLQRILQISTGGWATGILATAVIHSLFTHIEAGADTPEALRRKAGISPRGVATLLDGLVGLGLLTVSEGRYRNSPDASAFLVEGKPSYAGGFPKIQFAQFSDWAAFPDVVRTGRPILDDAAKGADNAFWEELVPAIVVLSIPVVHAAAERLKIAAAGPISILDVGGGSGIYSAIWLSLNRQARAFQIDWGNVNRIARDFVARHGVVDRFSTIDGDFHSVPFGDADHDIGVYSHIAHMESPESNVGLFAKFRKALKPGGTLVVNDFVVENDRSGPAFPLLFRSEMLMRTRAGSTWTRKDYEAWLKEAGFTTVAIEPTPSPATLVYAS